MTLNEFKKIKRILDKLLAQFETQALQEGVDIFSSKFQDILRKVLEDKLQELGTTIDEYERLEQELEVQEIENKKAKADITLIGSEEVQHIREELLQSEKNTETKLGLLEENTNAELKDLEIKILSQIQDILKQLEQINWNTLGGKPEILTKDYVANEILKALGDIKIPEPTKPIDLKPIEERIDSIGKKVGSIKIPQVPDYRKLKKELSNDLADQISKHPNIIDMPNWRKAIMGLQGQIDALGGTGDVVGPASATDNAITRFDTTTGKLIQNSVITIADTTGNIAGVGTLNTHTIPSGTGILALTSDAIAYAIALG